MKKAILLSLALIAFTFCGSAQSYGSAIGIRGGNPIGITYKQSLGSSKYFEGILGSQWRGLSLTALLEFQKTPWATPGLAWYYGVGAHAGQFQGVYTPWAASGDYLVIGVDGIIGLEYTLQQAPLNFSLDYKPAFNLIGYTGAWFDGFAMSIRFTF